MKKITLLSLFFIFGIIGVSNAQLEQGNFMLGTDMSSGIANATSNGLISMNFGLNDGAGYEIGISPKAGYFFTDNFVAGAIVNLGFSKSAENSGVSTKTFVYGAQAFSRFYIRPADANLGDEIGIGSFFIETSAGIAGVNVTGGPSTNGFAFGFGPGYSYFLNESVALEANLKYNGLVGAGNEDFQSSLGLNFGIQIFLSGSTAREAVNEIENEF